MNNFEDITAVWQQGEPQPLPDAKDIIARAGREKKLATRNILVQSCCMLLTLLAFAYVLYAVKFHYNSSYIGIAIMSCCVIAFVYIRLRQSLFLSKLNFNDSPTGLLRQLKMFHTDQRWISSTGTLIYTVFLNVGFGFYFYETLILAPMTLAWKLLFLIIYIAWMLIAVFVIGKRSARKELARTQSMIDKISQLEEGMHE